MTKRKTMPKDNSVAREGAEEPRKAVTPRMKIAEIVRDLMLDRELLVRILAPATLGEMMTEIPRRGRALTSRIVESQCRQAVDAWAGHRQTAIVLVLLDDLNEVLDGLDRLVMRRFLRLCVPGVVIGEGSPGAVESMAAVRARRGISDAEETKMNPVDAALQLSVASADVCWSLSRLLVSETRPSVGEDAVSDESASAFFQEFQGAVGRLRGTVARLTRTYSSGEWISSARAFMNGERS